VHIIGQYAIENAETVFAQSIQCGRVLQLPGTGVRRAEQKDKDRSFFQKRPGERSLRKIQNRKTRIKPVQPVKPVFGCQRNPWRKTHQVSCI